MKHFLSFNYFTGVEAAFLEEIRSRKPAFKGALLVKIFALDNCRF